MCEAFRAHFRDRIARCPELPVQEFRCYLGDFPRLGEAEAASCEGLVTECEVRDVLKQVGPNKSPGLDGLPYKVYLRMSHMFVPILTDMFNHWFSQGAIPGSITKSVITLLRKGCWHVWEDLDDYRPITLLSTELKILAWVLANRLQLVISDLIEPEQNYVVKRRSIKDNLHLVHEIPKRLEDDTEAALINLDQSKAGRVAPCPLFSMSSLWSPCSVGLGMRGLVRPCLESPLPAVSVQRSLRTPMISLSFGSEEGG